MYTPALNENLIRTLYRLKRASKKSMTELAEALIVKSLKTVDKDMVCRVCIGEKNNDCESCCLK